MIFDCRMKRSEGGANGEASDERDSRAGIGRRDAADDDAPGSDDDSSSEDDDDDDGSDVDVVGGNGGVAPQDREIQVRTSLSPVFHTGSFRVNSMKGVNPIVEGVDPMGLI